MTEQPDHELEVLEVDQTVPPRPEEIIADAVAAGAARQEAERRLTAPAG
jgi:hypothetical protein